MSMSQAFVQELEQEAQATRRVLERVPEERLTWKPHEKSMSLGQLALHVATVPGNVAEISKQSRFPLPDFTQEAATSAAQLVPALEASIEQAKGVLAEMDDAAMGETWTAVAGDREVMSVPRVGVLRSIMLNHWYHHRGQLTVYLRLLDVPLPSVYGPSADENPFG